MGLIQSLLHRQPEEGSRSILAVSNIDLDTLFEMVSNPRRRLVITWLADNEEPISLSDLAEYIAFVEETDISRPHLVPSDARKRAYISLYQMHLPRLHEAGLINWNSDDAYLVEPTEATYPAAELIRSVRIRNGGVFDGC